MYKPILVSRGPVHAETIRTISGAYSAKMTKPGGRQSWVYPDSNFFTETEAAQCCLAWVIENPIDDDGGEE